MSRSDVVGGILCAGYGTRLRPLTATVPKPLVPFLNSPLVTYALDHLSSIGVERVGANLHHLAESIPPVVDRIAGNIGMQTVYAREWDILGTAGGIAGIWRALGEPDATLVVFNGDSVMNIDLARHLAEHREADRPATLVVRPSKQDQPGGVWLDDDRRLRGIRDYRDPEAGDDLGEFEFAGVHLLEPELLADIPVEKGDVIDEVYGPMLERAEPITASVNEDFWAALDNPELFFSVTCELLDHPDRFVQAPLDPGGREGVYLGPGVDVPEDVEIEPPVFIGPEVEWNGEASIGPYLVADGIDVDEEARLRRSVLYGTEPVEDTVDGILAVADQRIEHGV
ncbi:MAG: NDP-sugar synthase [Bradymonadaceae bacterium]